MGNIIVNNKEIGEYCVIRLSAFDDLQALFNCGKCTVYENAYNVFSILKKELELFVESLIDERNRMDDGRDSCMEGIYTYLNNMNLYLDEFIDMLENILNDADESNLYITFAYIYDYED